MPSNLTPHPFVVESDTDDLVTPRTRFLLWASIGILCDQLLDDLDDFEASGPISIADTAVMRYFPRIVWAQDLPWWEALLGAGGRLCESMRTGVGCTPVSPAEEAVLWVALTRFFEGARQGWEEEIEDPEFDSLPRDEADSEDWRMVHASLCLDEHVALLWDPAHDGIEAPDSEENVALGMGSFRPAAWFDNR